MIFKLNDMLELTDIVDIISKRLYVLVGLFAMFKLAFSLLRSVIDPEKFSDKKEGVGNIIQRTVVSIIMLIALPMAFDKLFLFQNHIIAAIPPIILGREVEDNGQTSLATGVANATLFAFIKGNNSCSDSDSSQISFETNEDGIFQITDIVTQKCNSDGTKYKYSYTFFISTVVGLVMILVFFPVCIDVVIRAFKLLALYMLAPLPIISYIDPKSSNGGMFDSWLKLFIKTYISIFIQMASIYFVFALLTTLLNKIAIW